MIEKGINAIGGMIGDDSKCQKDILCNFQRIGDYEDALVEDCIFCGKRVIYNKWKGEIDDAKYLRDHRRDTLQPFGQDRELYRRIYGLDEVNSAIKRFGKRKSKQQLDEEWKILGKEARDYVNKRTLSSDTRGTDWT